MKVRRARAEDAAALADIQVSSYRTAYAGLMPADYLAHFRVEEQEEDWRDLLAEPAGDIVLVAEVEGDLAPPRAPATVAGYAVGRPRAVEVGGRVYDAELVSLHVRGEWQGRGAGRALAGAMARALEEQGCGSLALFVLAGNRAWAFYERLGGQRVGEKRWVMDGFGFEVVETGYGWAEIGALG